MTRNNAPLTAAQSARALGLGSRRPSQRTAAARAIRAMGAEAVPFLVEVVQEEKERRNRGRRRVLVTWVVAFAIGLALQLFVTWRGWWHDVGEMLQLAMVLINALFGATAVSYAFRRDCKRDACAILAEAGDARAVGPLVEAADGFGTDEDRAVVKALTELLPQLRASDSHLLDRDEYRKLVAELREAAKDLSPLPRIRIDFDIAIIRALEQIGDEEAEKSVRKIAALPAYNCDCERLIAAAQAALPALEARAGADRVGRTLLRAASAPEAGGELLRPASGAAPAEPEQLLRPVVTNGDGES